jgi:glutamate/aspartate transport system substrate-binding protein
MRKARFLIALACVVAASSVQAADSDLGPTLSRIKAAGVLHMAFRDGRMPLSYLDEQKAPVGFAIDLCTAIANKVKAKLGLAELKTEFQPLGDAEAADALAKGAIDIDCGLSTVPGNPDQNANPASAAGLSQPVFVSEYRWLVFRRGRISSVDNLKGKAVALLQGAPIYTSLIYMSADRALGLSLQLATNERDLFKQLESGRVSATLERDVSMTPIIASVKKPELYGFLDETYQQGETLAFALPKGDAQWKAAVDEALDEALQAENYTAAYKKWFLSQISAKPAINFQMPMSAAVRALMKDRGKVAGRS